MKTRSCSDSCGSLNQSAAFKRSKTVHEEDLLSPSKRFKVQPMSASTLRIAPGTSPRAGGSTLSRSTSKIGSRKAIKPQLVMARFRGRLPRKILNSEDEDTVAENLQEPNRSVVPNEPALALPASPPPPPIREEITRPVSPISGISISDDSESESDDAGADISGIRIYTDVEDSSFDTTENDETENHATSSTNENSNLGRKLPTTTAEARENPISMVAVSASRRTGAVLPMHVRRGPGRCMTNGEMQEVLNYVCNNRLIGQVGGNTIWKAMADEKIVPDRTWHTLRTNFRNTILKNLDRFKIPNKKDYEKLVLLSNNK